MAVKLNGEKIEGNKLLQKVEVLINSIAKTPKSFHEDIDLINKNVKQFRNILAEFNEIKHQNLNVGKAAGGGAAIAAGAGALAPTALMGIATTLGTASTGTAIATLSGAAATNAALAWIGGGALAAGGGGMAAGNAFLAACGPVGWAVAGVLLCGGAGWNIWKNKKEGEKAVKKAERILRKANSINISTEKVEGKYVEISAFSKEFKKIFSIAKVLEGSNYSRLGAVDQDCLVDLVNKSVIYSKLIKWNLNA